MYAGYVTNSQVKFMAIIADTYSFSMNQQQRETELKSFFVSLPNIAFLLTCHIH